MDPLISPIISELTSIISSWVQEEYKLVVGVKEEIEKLKKDFTAIQDVLEDAEMRQFKENGVRNWLDNLKQVCYDMEDVLADWRIAIHEWEIKEADAKAAAADKSKFFAGCCSPLNRCFNQVNQVKPRLDIARRIQGICERVDDIDKMKSRYSFKFNECSAPKQRGASESRVTTSYVDEPKMRGRRDDKKKLIKKLLCTVEKSTQEVPVVAIVGEGGLGKTTLAQLAYNDEKVKAHFEEMVWICVSEQDIVSIGRGIIQALDKKADTNFHQLDLLLNTISELIKGKRFLLVLDDVWNDRDKWKQLKQSLSCGNPHSRILVTTRKNNVAEVMETTYELPIKRLSDDECWLVFRELAFRGKNEDECKKLEDIGWKIVVDKVKGLPLAASILGGLMQSKTEWKDILSSNLWELEGVENKLFGPLLLSYYDLPAAIRKCFTYCTMFPKGTTMLKSDMIRMWMAQGYLNKSTSSKEELLGEEYFNNLVVRYFFQILKVSGDDIEFKMHDIVHDSVQILSENECFSCTGKENRTESCFNERVRHLSLLSPSIEDLESVCSAKSLRSLYIEDHSETIVEALPKLLRNLKYLRALYLRSRSIQDIPSEVKELKHLRYLNLVSFRFPQNSTMDAIISPITSELRSIITSWVKEEYKLVVDVKKEIIKLKNYFTTIQAVLVDAERRQFKDFGVRNWLDELKQVCYDMEDVLADWRIAIHEWDIKEADAKAAAADKSKFFAGCCSPLNRSFNQVNQVNQVKRQRDIAQRIKDICERLDQIDKRKYNYGFNAPAEKHEQPITSKSRVTTSHTDGSLVYGRDADKYVLINKLLCAVEKSTREVPVVAIVGQGGIGKTTLAQLAYNDEEVKAHFEKRVWICISEPFDKVNIARGIIRALDKDANTNFLPLNLLLYKISELVNKKRFLLVLDDVWSEDRVEWEQLKLSLGCGNPHSRILVTTRKKKVAEVMGTTNELLVDVGLLNEESCWNMFRKLAFSGRSRDECKKLEPIGRKIVVDKVKGLPLAASILGALMQSQTEWEDVLSSNLWELEGVESKLFGPLLLSYYDLPAAMRRCFTYCAMFPKDTTMRKSDMIRMWMAQGYLNKATSSNQMELVGEEYFHNLVMRSFFQILEVSGDDIEFKMHDIVHDSAQILSGNECLSCNGKEIRTESCFNERVRHLSLLSPSREDLEFVCSAKSLRSLYIEDHSETIVEALPKLLRNLKYLRALYLVSDSIKEIPSEVKYLRALYLVSDSIKEIPSEVKKLKHLRYLRLGGLLRHLILFGSELGSEPSVDLVALARLPSLEILQLSCVNIRKYNMGDEEGGTSSMVARFPKLKELWLSDIEGLEELPDCILKILPQLQQLSIHSCPILKKHYNKEIGKYWNKISHIPKVHI